MRVAEILAGYSDESLDRLTADKVDEVANLRLPREVLVQEVSSALSSLSYVAKALAPARPPTYAFLKLLMDSEDHRSAAAGFRRKVLEHTAQLTELADSGAGLPKNKEYDLYLRILHAAWEDDGHVDRSEALLLTALRNELGLGIREHLLLEHHSAVRPIWESPSAYEEARSLLLTKGLVLVDGDDYVLPDEVCRQIRRTWEIELEDVPYSRLLSMLTSEQLRDALENAALPLSGSKEERIARLIEALVPPTEVLSTLHIDQIKDLCRANELVVSLSKNELIENLIDYFDSEKDLEPPEEDSEDEMLQPEPEDRAISDDRLTHLLLQLKLDQLYDISAGLELKRTGSKSRRVGRLVESPWSEHTLLDQLRRVELSELCRGLGVPVSGVKKELIDRLVDWVSRQPLGAASAEESVSPPETPVDEEVAAVRDGLDQRAATPTPSETEEEQVLEGLEEIKSRFPDLRTDQQTILALLRSARSLTEHEIERSASRHDLGWFLTKAHMADLIAELRRRGSSPVRVRSTSRHNIYEWTGGDEESTTTSLDRQASRDVIDALRHGVVPETHLNHLIVGQSALREHLLDLLEHVKDGRSEFKFVRGPYGAGKSFLCSWLKEQALSRDFAVATVKIGPDQPLSDLPVFFSGLVDGLRTSEKRDASALADILESWLLALHRRASQLEGIEPFTAEGRKRLAPLVEEEIEEELSRLSELDAGFAPAVRAFYRASLDRDHEKIAVALSWLKGSRAHRASKLRSLGVRGKLEAEGVFPRMRAILDVIEQGRLEGLLVVVDELELVRRFPHTRQRERAYETLRLLIDECGENRLPGCLLVCTGTDQLFDDERYGLPSYRALAHRVHPPRDGTRPKSVRQPILELEGLDRERLLQVAVRVRGLHAKAYDWPAGEKIPDKILERMVDDATAFGDDRIERIPRPFLRDIVNFLDLCEERPEVEPEDFLIDVGARDAPEKPPAGYWQD